VSITETGGLVSVRPAIVVATKYSIVSITEAGGLVSVDGHSVFPFVLQ
jgi:hypothetical protein